ncbi:hypothetical protein BECAL_01022 [Bellilinea caldifistulae]|uniref:TlpA family protein disulfide reductase n=1 Tax=Bellilinea caldifistulae TaxID=360411 RepID=UPI0007802B43|nr:redoxin family protein [Bellilinea caldifistulae]GAP09869.1 hypothetical protein BECAL_01022 [Bellilinea caldifistulae]
MKRQFLISNLLIVMVFLLTACAPGGVVPATVQENTPLPVSTGVDEMKSESVTPDGDENNASQSQSQTPIEEGESSPDTQTLPDWFKVELVNVENDEVFTIESLTGKVILVETMAQWCSNCLRQQQEVKALHQLLGEREDFVSIGLDIDPNEDAATLKSYIARHEFNWIYAVSPAEVSRSLSDLYGPQFLSPPSTPMLIIDRAGSVYPLPMGIKSAERLREFLQPYLETNR